MPWAWQKQKQKQNPQRVKAKVYIMLHKILQSVTLGFFFYFTYGTFLLFHSTLSDLPAASRIFLACSHHRAFALSLSFGKFLPQKSTLIPPLPLLCLSPHHLFSDVFPGYPI